MVRLTRLVKKNDFLKAVIRTEDRGHGAIVWASKTFVGYWPVEHGRKHPYVLLTRNFVKALAYVAEEMDKVRSNYSQPASEDVLFCIPKGR